MRLVNYILKHVEVITILQRTKGVNGGNLYLTNHELIERKTYRTNALKIKETFNTMIVVATP